MSFRACPAGAVVLCDLSASASAHADYHAVAPGQVGRFDFTVQAPPVAAVTKFREHFEPLAADQADPRLRLSRRRCGS